MSYRPTYRLDVDEKSSRSLLAVDKNGQNTCKVNVSILFHDADMFFSKGQFHTESIRVGITIEATTQNSAWRSEKVIEVEQLDENTIRSVAEDMASDMAIPVNGYIFEAIIKAGIDALSEFSDD